MRIPLIIISIICTLGIIGFLFINRAPQAQPSTLRTPSSMPSDAPPASDRRYVPYSEAAFTAASGKIRVYFFYASWCPTCAVAHKEFTNQVDAIPSDVVLFQTNYDTETTLKKTYAITYQHTFVAVDSEGTVLRTWNGGGMAELVENTTSL